MSLAMYAAPFDEIHSSVSNDDNYIHKKKQYHNKTQKMFPKESFTNNTSIVNSGTNGGSGTNSSYGTPFHSKKVNSVLEHLHNKSAEEDEEDEPRTFTPPPPPHSSGSERKAITEGYKLLGNAPQPNKSDDDLALNNYQSNYHNSKNAEDYYKNMLPGPNKYDFMTPNPSPNQDILLQKLNYMIHLLEEQQDERTNNVTEEVVLYSFLGIFIIFIADSFVRIGKYVR